MSEIARAANYLRTRRIGGPWPDSAAATAGIRTARRAKPVPPKIALTLIPITAPGQTERRGGRRDGTPRSRRIRAAFAMPVPNGPALAKPARVFAAWRPRFLPAPQRVYDRRHT
ncbi:hypothetical protein [Mycolicibacterium mageritense]|uniref:hypothetical protein n=1 Tax=Mycolicibacterium mageritense TaxID=53462 RepID=UPI001E515058|nr:hypothetical protein [Mycolicibacterium mageritense]GJJ20494.1 hypothetical protein MTY414_41670 [Mycolicibacterium mageritense]